MLLPKVWQWIRHRAALEEGGFVTTNLVHNLVAEVVAELGGLKEVAKPVIRLIFTSYHAHFPFLTCSFSLLSCSFFPRRSEKLGLC